MSIKKTVVVAAATLTLIAGIGVASPGPAFATQQQICGNGGSGYCMNDWNGDNQYVKMYNGSVSHEDFEEIYNVSECGSGSVTSTYYGDATNCPFVDANLDRAFRGDPIVQIEYIPTSQCIGTTSSGTAWLGSCANNEGVGGGTGVTLINVYEGGSTALLINRYWSDYYSSGSNYQPCFVYSGGNPGAYLWMNSDESGGNCADRYSTWGNV